MDYMSILPDISHSNAPTKVTEHLNITLEERKDRLKIHTHTLICTCNLQRLEMTSSSSLLILACILARLELRRCRDVCTLSRPGWKGRTNQTQLTYYNHTQGKGIIVECVCTSISCSSLSMSSSSLLFSERLCSI